MLRVAGTIRASLGQRYRSCLKPISAEFETKYESDGVEQGWDREWSQKRAETHEKSNKEYFRMVLPPPNITGDLHLGHALTIVIEDAICRFKKLTGLPYIWIPGTDHAGIATQTVLERMLEKQHSRVSSVSEEERLKVAFEWRHEKERVITSQLRRLGASLNWQRSFFTMDENMSSAVSEAFVRFHRAGRIYRDQRLVNWCSVLRSTISDIEVDHVEVKPNQNINGVNVGCMHQFAYPVVGGGEVVVSTTRLETMLADVAVAVHPEDERYAHLNHLQTMLEHPVTKKKLKLLKDAQIDRNMGTGAMKVTPAYSRIDFDLCLKYGITDFYECFDDAGLLTTEGFQGDTCTKASKKILGILEQMALYRGITPRARTVPVCSRTGSFVDQRLKPQWFLKCADLGQRTLEEVESGRLEFIPAYHTKVLQDWISKTQDWCISRQLWWGHRIPAYILPDGQWLVSNDRSAVPDNARQDPDVLDTWFSSALCPLVAFGWPQVAKPPPLDLMETGHDILYFWVFRMVLMSLELCGQVPFKKVLLHGLLRDANGRKMSKSLGNAIDPIHIVDGASLVELQTVANKLHASGYLHAKELQEAQKLTRQLFPNGIPRLGADPLRFSLLKMETAAQDINFDIRHTVTSRNFCNKIWQGVRFFANAPKVDCYPSTELSPGNESLDELDRWILSRLSAVETSVRESLESYSKIHLAPHELEKFWICSFCDVYLEASKPDVWGSSKDLSRRLSVMQEVISSFIVMASPFLPHLCEEIHHKLQLRSGTAREECSSVHECSWPKMSQWKCPLLEERMNSILDRVSEIRRIMKEGSFTDVVEELNTLNDFDRYIIRTLCKIKPNQLAQDETSMT